MNGKPDSTGSGKSPAASTLSRRTLLRNSSDGGYFALGNSRRPLLKNSGQVSSHCDQPWLSRQLILLTESILAKSKQQKER